MNGYDKEAAFLFIKAQLNPREYKPLSDLLDTLLRQAIDADIAFMHESGVLDEDGNAGDAYYEEDDAIEYIVEKLVEDNQLTPEQAVLSAAFVSDFIDCQYNFLTYSGLIQDED